jgi:trehalose-phosphatase
MEKPEISHEKGFNLEAGWDGKRPIEDLPSALDWVDLIADQIGDRQVVFFLDFDGTLAPIVERPEAATLPPRTRQLIADLATRHYVAIVSGRDLDDLRERVGLDSVYYAGSHGFQIVGPEGQPREREEARRFLPVLEDAEAILTRRLASIEGAEVDRKRYGVAVHFRRASECAAGTVRNIIEDVQRTYSGLRIGQGRKVFELRPHIPWDKGRAIGWLIQVMGLKASSVFPICIGDDVTDEDAFRAIAGKGVAIVVRGREGSTRANYVLDDQTAVREFMSRLDAELGGT